MSKEFYRPEELDHYRKVQRLAYQAAMATREQLKVGMTEKEAAKRMRRFLELMGVEQFFHFPFAWFGDRTAFENFSIPLSYKTHLKKKITWPSLSLPLPHFGLEFRPSNRRLEEGMAVILDAAPTLGGHAADIGYAFSFGPNELVEQGKRDLLPIRDLILEGARAKKTMAQIYREVDALMEKLGYHNCHSIYPQRVLGHKVGQLPRPWGPSINILGFEPQTFIYLGRQLIAKWKGKSQTPLWNDLSEVTLEPGLWAIEPHMGKQGVGVKFEEIMVVTEDNCYWLDDDLPHVNLH